MLLSGWTSLNVFNSVPNERPEFQIVLELLPEGDNTVISKEINSVQSWIKPTTHSFFYPVNFYIINKIVWLSPPLK